GTNAPVAPPTITFTFDDADASQLVNQSAYDGTSEREVDIWHYAHYNDGNDYWVRANSGLSLTPSNGLQTLTMTGVTSFSPFAIAKTSGPLPVTLLNFSGHRVGAVNQLSWTTTTELNNEGFDVQRSADGLNFTTIGFVQSKALNGNSSDQLHYTFTDAALTGIKQYYRLRQVDLNSVGKLSQIILINGDRPRITKIDGVFPNPARNLLNIIVAASQNETLTIQVADMNGRTLQQQIVTVGEGSNTVPVNVDKLSSGNYVIRIVTASGVVASQKFLKL
nr:T9SS type A sorting domain-containing protein [Chitinophagaceae bacterium]